MTTIFGFLEAPADSVDAARAIIGAQATATKGRARRSVNFMMMETVPGRNRSSNAFAWNHPAHHAIGPHGTGSCRERAGRHGERYDEPRRHAPELQQGEQ